MPSKHVVRTIGDDISARPAQEYVRADPEVVYGRIVETF